jgi:eukaryotic-like serine/threonine-protein kinase
VAGYEQTTPIRVGRTLSGRYRLVAPIARGGMAEVWEAYDETLSRPVAAKLLQAHLASDAVFLERFRREAVTAARLGHPGIVATFDTGFDDGTAFIVMELVRGRNLRQLLSDHGSLEPWQAVAVARQVADALAYAHQAGLVHRDIKPANVLLVEEEWGAVRVKVTDFGIAKASAGIDNDLTRTGTVLGTPKYLSPEQIRGEEPDARADLYSLGVVLYEMLAGVPPFVADTDMAVALAHLNNPVPTLSKRVPGVPIELDRLVGDLLAKDPARRVPSAAAARQRLDALGPLAPPTSSAVGNSRPAKWTLRSRPPTPGASNGASGPAAHPGLAAPATTVMGYPGDGAPPTVAGPVVLPPLSGTGPARVAMPPVGPTTDEFTPPKAPNRFRRSERRAGVAVLILVLVGAVVSGVLYLTGKHRHASAAAPPAAHSTATPEIVSASVFMVNSRQPDDPLGTKYIFDGDSSTAWYTDKYGTPTFGNLYPGIGLAITLASSRKLTRLEVITPTTGWAAQVYVSADPIASGQPVSAWGQPTDSQSNISGDASFSLGGRTGRYVLLFLTNLGPQKKAEVNEVKVS